MKMAEIKTIYKGESVTLLFTFPEAYDMARLASHKIFVGETEFAGVKDGQTIKMQLKSSDTDHMIGTHKVVLWIDDAVLGLRKPYCGDLVVAKTQASGSNTSVSNISDIIIPVVISETAITVGDVLYNYVKGDKGKPFLYSDFTPEQIAELQQPAADAIASIEAVELAVEQAEGLRVQAEQSRQTNTATAIQNAENATTSANNAASLANEKAGLANNAAILANEKAGLANNAATNANNAAINATKMFENYNSFQANVEKTISGSLFNKQLTLEPASIQVYDVNNNILNVNCKYVKNGNVYDIIITSTTDLSYAKIVVIGRTPEYAKGWAFEKPTSGNIEIPVNTLTGWSTRNTGGTPAAALSLVDISDSNTIKKIGSGKSVHFRTGVTGHSENQAIYTFSTPISLADFNNKNILIWVKIVDGVGISAWNTALGLYCYARQDNSNIYSYVLAGVNAEYASAGWYAFSFTPSKINSTIGNPTVINSISIAVAKAVANSPEIEIGAISIVPKKSNAQVCFMCDGGYISHKSIADLLTSHGMNATFYVAEDTHILSISDLLAMQNNGHLIANYVRNWGNGIDLAGRLLKITTNQTWLSNNGFMGGRHLVHGITSKMTEELWTGIIPDYADTIAYGKTMLTPQFHKTHFGRYHEFTSGNKEALVTLVNQAVTDSARLGILCHDLTGANYTAFVDYVENTLLPLQTAGSINVINVEQAYNS